MPQVQVKVNVQRESSEDSNEELRKAENEKQINIRVGDLRDLSSADSEEEGADEKENISKRSKKSKT